MKLWNNGVRNKKNCRFIVCDFVCNVLTSGYILRHIVFMCAQHDETHIIFYNLLLTRLEDEIIINGEVYVRKTPSQGTHGQGVSSASAVVSLQEKLNRKKLEEENAQDDLPDGGIMSVQMIKQKMRYFRCKSPG